MIQALTTGQRIAVFSFLTLACGWWTPIATGQRASALGPAESAPVLRQVPSIDASSTGEGEVGQKIQFVTSGMPIKEQTSDEVLAEKHQEVSSQLRSDSAG